MLGSADVLKSEKLIDKVVEFGKYINAAWYFVSGGEPFTQPKVLERFLDKVDDSCVDIGTNGLLTKNIDRIMSNYDCNLGITVHYDVLTPTQLAVVHRNVIRYKERIAFVKYIVGFGEVLTKELEMTISVFRTMNIHVTITPKFVNEQQWNEDIVKYKKFKYKSEVNSIIRGELVDANELYGVNNETMGMMCDTTDNYFFDSDGYSYSCGYTRGDKKSIYEYPFNQIVRTECIMCPKKYCSTSMTFTNKHEH